METLKPNMFEAQQPQQTNKPKNQNKIKRLYSRTKLYWSRHIGKVVSEITNQDLCCYISLHGETI